MNNKKTKMFYLAWLLLLPCISNSYAQRYGNKFIIGPSYYFNQFTIDRIGQQIYADYYGGRVYKIDLKTMAIDTTRFYGIAPTFGNRKHIMFYRDTLYNMDNGSYYTIPLPDSPKFVGRLTYTFPFLFSPNDSCLMFSINSTDIPYLVNGYIFSLKDSSLTQIDTSVVFTAASNGELIPQWSSDTSFVYGTSDSCLVEYFIGSKRIDTLVASQNHNGIGSFAYNTSKNFLAYSWYPGYVGTVPDQRIYFHYKNPASDSLVFSLQSDSTCRSLANGFASLCWSPYNHRLGLFAGSSVNEVTSIYFYLMDSSRMYRATQYCNDPDNKYALQWANEDTLIYSDATDGHLYGMDVRPVTDAVQARKTEPLPTDFSVTSYPNPFNPSTAIRYQLSTISYVTVEIYNTIGQEVVTLVSHEKQTAGTRIIHWDATNSINQKVASGFYFAVLRIDDSEKQITKVTKLIYLK